MSRYGLEIARHRFTRIAPEFDATVGVRRKVYNDALTAIAIEVGRALGAENVLDAGCGTGWRTVELSEAFPAARIEALDSSQAMIDIARARGVANAKCGSLAELNAERRYDLILSLFFVIGYLTPREMREQAINCLFRALRPGGMLVIDGMNRSHRGEGRGFHKSRLKIMRDIVLSCLNPWCELGDKFYRTTHPFGELAGFHHTFSQPELEGLVSGAGFVVRRSLVVGYDTGELHDRIEKGQLVVICEKPYEQGVGLLVSQEASIDRRLHHPSMMTSARETAQDVGMKTCGGCRGPLAGGWIR